MCLLLVVVAGSLLDYLVSLTTFDHANLREVGEEVGPHHVVLFKQKLNDLAIKDMRGDLPD